MESTQGTWARVLLWFAARASGRPGGLCSALVSPEKPEEGEASTTEAAWGDHKPWSAPGRRAVMREPALPPPPSVASVSCSGVSLPRQDQIL